MKAGYDGTTLTVTTASASETEEVGRIAGASLGPGDVVGLVGDLGTGKTCFTRGVAIGAGVSPAIPVVSPSFTILNEYGGRVPVYHFDFYRLDAPGRELDWEWREYFYGQGIVVIEWADKVAAFLPDDYLLVHFEFCGDTERILRLEGHGEAGHRLVLACEQTLRFLEERAKEQKT